MNFTFTLTLEEANVVLTSLSKMPYESVVNLITKLKQQADAQMQENQTREEE